MSEDCYEPPTTTLPRGLNLPRHSTLCRITIGYRTRWADLQLSRVLPVLDPTPMGWKQRDWLLGIDQRQLFGRADNIRPALWWDGEVVGAWAVTSTGDIRTAVVADGRAEADRAIQDAAARMHNRLEGTAVTPLLARRSSGRSATPTTWPPVEPPARPKVAGPDPRPPASRCTNVGATSKIDESASTQRAPTAPEPCRWLFGLWDAVAGFRAADNLVAEAAAGRAHRRRGQPIRSARDTMIPSGPRT
jgi:hypothetical protein